MGGLIDRCVEYLSAWIFKLSKRFRKGISECKSKLVALYEVDNANVSTQIKEVKDLMLKLLAQEDTFWKQRAKCFWLRDGDSNSKFFHSIASTRRRSNHVKGLYNEDGIYVDNIDDMCGVALHYF